MPREIQWNAVASRAGTSFRCIPLYPVGLCCILSGSADGEFGIADCRLGIVDCKMSLLGLVLRSRHRSRIVREFCFVKFGAGEIPAFAGMTWVGAGMTWASGGMAWECAGVTWVGAGVTWVGAGMTWASAGMTWASAGMTGCVWEWRGWVRA